jgi:uncharacterized GH25 family protein/thiol-disulfide isomerase/thioredoxin
MCRSCRAVPSSLALLALLAVLITASDLLADNQPTTATTGSMRIKVVDSAGQPVARAHIEVSIWTSQKDFKRKRNYTADAQGLTTIELPATLEIIRVWPSAKGYASMLAQLWPQSPIDAHPLPDEFTFTLHKGTTMGGIVHDDQGQPIKGVRVEVQYRSGGLGADSSRPAEYSTWLAYGILAKTTDAQGRWRIDNAPPGDDVQVRIELSHRDYIADGTSGARSPQADQIVYTAQLRAQTATTVMRRGAVVTGRVTSPDRQPLAGAVVVTGDSPFRSSGRKEVATDKDGRYRIGPLGSGSLRVTVVAQGWMPQTRKVKVAPELQPVDFQLEPGANLRIKFVDSAGAPLPQTYVTIRKWRGTEALAHFNDLKPGVPSQADNDGTFNWSWAPDDVVEYGFYKEGFAETTASITADGQEHVQTLHRVLQIAGTVTDAASGKPIDHFRVLSVIHFSPEFPFLERRSSSDGRGGKFAMEFERTDIEHGVQIEAPGYMTFRTDRRYRIGEPNPTLDVRLQPVARAVGKVVDEEGRPAEGARVYVATHFQHLDLNDLKENDFSSNYGVVTDALGVFEIIPQLDRHALVVIAPAGYCEAERSAGEPPGELRLQPWAMLQGRVIQDGKPMSGREVMFMPIRMRGGGEPRVDSYLRTTTADDGSFRFERVPPITCRVRPHLHFSVDSPLKSSRSMPLDLAPGENATVDLGGGGAEVTGQLVLDEPRDNFDFHFSLTYLVAQRPGIEPPAFLSGKGFDWRSGWSDSWRHSREGGAYLDTLHHWFVKPDPDGRIRISGVEPGEYELAVALYGTTGGCLVHPQAQRVVPVTVSAGRPALDLGKIVIPTQPVPEVGGSAANFEFATPQGKQTDLAALRGKFVLIDFWATWCGPCVARLDEVEELRREFGRNDRLVVVGANLDADSERAAKFLAKKSLAWHRALLGEWSDTQVPAQYGVTSVPAYVLVDPEGRIAAREYSLEKIADLLRSAKTEPPNR